MKTLRAYPLFLLSLALMLGLGLGALLLPRREVSEMENRPLAQFSVPTVASLRSGRWMRQTEEALNDQFPFRDGWVQAGALWDALLLRNERNGILLGLNHRLFAQPWYSPGEIANIGDNLAAMDALAKVSGLPTRVGLVPTSASIHRPELTRSAPYTDEGALLAALTEDLVHARYVRVDASPRTMAGGTPMYYRTDHHWTAEGAFAAYAALRTEYPAPQVSGDLRQLTAEGFYGSYFARASSPLIPPDTLTFSYPPGLRLTIDGQEMPGLVDEAQLARRDKYAALLWGTRGALTLTNDRVAEGTLLVIRDSYASALLPLLAMHFHRVEAVDPRSFTGDLLSYIEEKEATQILCLYGLSTLRTDRSLLLATADFAP